MRSYSAALLLGALLASPLPPAALSAAELAPSRTHLAANEAELKLGEYTCMGSGGTILIGLGFRVLPGRKYVSLDNTEGGSYALDAQARIVTFIGGFLAGQKG